MRRANNDTQRSQWGFFEYQSAHKAGQVAQMGLLSLILALTVVGAAATISSGFKEVLSQFSANLF